MSKAASDTEGEQVDQPEASSSAAIGLTDDQLMEVFKQTSIFNVKSALANNQNLMQNETAEDQEHDFFSDSDISDTDEWDYLRGFWSGKFCQPMIDMLTQRLHCAIMCIVSTAADLLKTMYSSDVLCVICASPSLEA